MVDIPRIKFFEERRYRANWSFMDGSFLLSREYGKTITPSGEDRWTGDPWLPYHLGIPAKVTRIRAVRSTRILSRIFIYARFHPPG
jgi:hypothetical protein